MPRRALPLPQTETKVVEAVHIKFAQMEMVTNRCKHACESAHSGLSCEMLGERRRAGVRAFWA